MLQTFLCFQETCCDATSGHGCTLIAVHSAFHPPWNGEISIIFMSVYNINCHGWMSVLWQPAKRLESQAGSLASELAATWHWHSFIQVAQSCFQASAKDIFVRTVLACWLVPWLSG